MTDTVQELATISAAIRDLQGKVAGITLQITQLADHARLSDSRLRAVEASLGREPAMPGAPAINDPFVDPQLAAINARSVERRLNPPVAPTPSYQQPAETRIFDPHRGRTFDADGRPVSR